MGYSQKRPSLLRDADLRFWQIASDAAAQWHVGCWGMNGPSVKDRLRMINRFDHYHTQRTTMKNSRGGTRIQRLATCKVALSLVC
jgi:hypothetical protein